MASSERRFAESFFESFTPILLKKFNSELLKQTPQIIIGPKTGPLPASSIPQISSGLIT
jgi:hypothetical protein